MTVIENVYNDIYSERSLSKKIRKIKRYKPARGIFVITFPIFNDGLLEIYDFNELTQDFYRKLDKERGICVIGISDSKEGAKSLAADIVYEFYKNTDGFNIRDSIMSATSQKL